MKPNEFNEKIADLVGKAQKLYNDRDGKLNDEDTKQFEGWMTEAKELEERADRANRLAYYDSKLNESRGRQSAPSDIELPPETEKRYSLFRAINCRLDGRPVDGLEGEVSAEIAKRTGKKPQGFFMPMSLRTSTAFDTTQAAGGINTYLNTGEFIDLLRNRLVVQKAGAKFIPGLEGTMALPRQSAATTAYWVAAGSAPTGSFPTLDQVTFTPKTVGAYTDIYRKTFLESSLDVQQIVTEDLAKVLAIEIDRASLNGSGSGQEPKGILQDSNISTTAIDTNGGAPTFATVVGMESAVAAANADMGALGYVTNAKVRGTLKQTPKIGTTFPNFLWDVNDSGNPVNDYPCYITNNMPSDLTKGTTSGTLSSMIFGNWNDLVIAAWSGLDILVDPYTGSSSGTVRIVMLQDLDIQVRHYASFNKCVDIVTS